MTRTLNKFSDRKARTVSRPGRYADGGGLYLEVKPSGTRAWLFMWKVGGKRKAMGLGAYPLIGLAEAREKAIDCRRTVKAGGDPLAQSRAETALTFGDVADRLLASREGSWRNVKHRDQWYYTLSRRRDADGKLVRSGFCLQIVDRPVDEIATEDILAVLTPIWTEKAETASRLRGRIEAVLDYARGRGWRTGENPARWRGHLSTLLPKRPKLQRGHHPAMPFEEVPAFVTRLRSHEAMAARALEFAILCASRSSEVLNALWQEIDFDKALWRIPPHRMKGAVAHTVPLSTRAITILRKLESARVSDYVFPGQRERRPLSGMSMEMLLRRMRVADVTPHGFRSSFRDWCGDVADVPRELAEAALAHKVGDETERAYRRADALEKRRKLMEEWADFVDGETGRVVALRRSVSA